MTVDIFSQLSNKTANNPTWCCFSSAFWAPFFLWSPASMFFWFLCRCRWFCCRRRWRSLVFWRFKFYSCPCWGRRLRSCPCCPCCSCPRSIIIIVVVVVCRVRRTCPVTMSVTFTVTMALENVKKLIDTMYFHMFVS